MLSHSLETRRFVGTARNSKKSFLAIRIQNDSEIFRKPLVFIVYSLCSPRTLMEGVNPSDLAES